MLACALFLVAAPVASALVVHGHNHHFIGIELHRGVKASSVPGSVAAQQPAPARPRDNGTLTYHNGPVVHSSAPYLIFWTPSGESIPSSSRSLMQRYFTDVAADSGESGGVYGVTRQYTDTAGFAGRTQTFNAGTQAIVDTQPYPATDPTNCSGAAPCITDAQLQQELTRLVAADGLPTDGPSGASEFPASAPIYFIVLPGDVNVCDGTVGCASTTFCAYHSSMTDGSNTLLYAAIPMLLADSAPKTCQADGNSAVQTPNGDPADVVIGDLSHEDNETLSDPTAGGWWDTSSGNEEADGCSMTGPFSPANETDPYAFLPTLGGSAGSGTLYDQLVNGNRYYTQSEWSNGDLTCEMRPSTGAITPSFTVSGTTTAGSSLTFDPSASTSTNAISSETWIFGDGSTPAFHTGNPASVSHAYASAGTYTVTLTLVDDRGNLQSTTQQIMIEPGPTASFSYSPSSPLEGTSVSFDARASSDPDPGATITSYAWDFGDGTTGTGATPSHTYATHGPYTVTLTVTDSAGLSNSTSHQITVADEAPSAAFTISGASHIVGQAVSFDGSTSSDPDGTIGTYAWNFGDKTSAGTGPTPSHSYAGPGTYTVTLTVTDSDGQSASIQHQITVHSLPTAAFGFSPSSPVEGTVVSFDGSGSSDPEQGATISSYAWNFGDNTSPGSAATPTHIYATHGTYTVTLTVTNSVGLTSTVTHQVTVADEPLTTAFTITPNPAVAGHPVAFNAAASIDPDSQISSYAWRFGDGTTGTGEAPDHSYSVAGTYTVTLTVSGSDGQTGSVTAQLDVLAPPPAGGITPNVTPAAAPPAAGFVITTPHPAARVPVHFSGARSADPSGSITAYSWSFGDGAHGTGKTPAHTYRKAGTYRVSLTVFASSGMSTSTSRLVIVVPGSRIRKISILYRQGSALVGVTLTGPGRLSVGARRFAAPRAETIKVRVTPTTAQRRRLRTAHRVTVGVLVGFTPRIGARTTAHVPITFSG